jgi:hypothetical protein
MNKDSKDRQFDVAGLLAASASQMRRDLAQRLINHPGELGTAREEIIRLFLRAYLPKRFEISTGFAFDSAGRISRQLDIIIADQQECPRFEIPGGKRLYPCEAIVAVGQIRSSLTSQAEFQEAARNLASATLLDRSANGRAVDPATGETLDPARNHLHRIFSFLFITGDALAPDTMHRTFMDYVLASHPQGWPNIVFALDAYLATFCCDSGVCPNPYDARGIAMQREVADDELLLRFYILLGRALAVTRVSGFPYWEYLHNARTWTAEVHYSTRDDPPPYLSAITEARE